MRQSLNENLLDRLAGSLARRIENSRRLRRFLRAGDVTGLQGLFHAVEQPRARGYADKYRALGEPIHLVGVEFSREVRNVVSFETAPAQ